MTTDSRYDPVAHDRAIRFVHDQVRAGDQAVTALRSVVSESWERSRAALLDPDRSTPPVVLTDADLPDVRSANPLSTVMPLLRETLASIADEANHVMLVTDAEGTILWREGAARLLCEADMVGMQPGTLWTEQAIGTNAMGTTLVLGAPVSIHMAEHFVGTYHSWTCAAAPVRDPDTDAILGAIDISGRFESMHPAMKQLVAATAQLAENQLKLRLAIEDEQLRARNMPHLESLRGRTGALLTASGRILAGEPYGGGWPQRVLVPAEADRVQVENVGEMIVERLDEGYLLRSPSTGRTVPRLASVRLRVTGEGAPSVTVADTQIPLTLRPAELLTVLALHPDGLTAEQLALLLYGDEGNPTTVRGEVLRLRSLIGNDVLRTRPYRLRAAVDADFTSMRRAIRDRKPVDALRHCAGPLLPRSDAPAIRDLRMELETGLRAVLLDADDVELLVRFADHPLGRDDLEVLDRLLYRLPPTDPRRPRLTTRRDQLLDG